MLISRPTKDALTILAAMIRAARIQRGMSAAKLAERIGVSRGAIQRLEAAEPGTSIGTAFEAAIVLGIPLFDVAADDLATLRKQKQDVNALLPQRAFLASHGDIDNDF